MLAYSTLDYLISREIDNIHVIFHFMHPLVVIYVV